jgi:MFS family permease
MRRILRDRNFRLLAVGQTLSAFGDYAMFLALAVWAKDLTGSDAAAGLTFLPFVIPSLIGPALGVFVDRSPRRWVMIWTDVAAGLSILLLLFVNDASDLWLIYVVSFLDGTAVAIYQAARSGLLVSMLPEDDLGDANGFLQAANQGMRLVAPLAGAGLFAFAGGHTVALLDSISFFVSAGFLLAVHSGDIERRTDEAQMWSSIREGLRHILRTQALRRLTLGTACVTLLIGVSEVVIFAVIDEGLHRPPEFLGVLMTLQGVGSVIAGLVAGTLLARFGEMRVVAVAVAAAGIGVGMKGSAMLWLVLAASFTFGVANILFSVGYVTLMQRRTPLDLQGRVMAAVEAAISAPYLLSIAAGAALVSIVDFRVICLVQAAGLLLASLYFTRAARKDEDAGPREPAYAADSIDGS